MFFFKLLKDALKVKNVRNKILFTIFIIFVFRVDLIPCSISRGKFENNCDLPFLNTRLILVFGT